MRNTPSAHEMTVAIESVAATRGHKDAVVAEGVLHAVLPLFYQRKINQLVDEIVVGWDIKDQWVGKWLLDQLDDNNV